MATPEEMAQSMINYLAEKTGNDLSQWVSILRKTTLLKHGEIVKHLKSEHNITHGYANLIAAKYREDKEGGNGSEVDLVASQYKNKAALKEIYDVVLEEIQGFGNDVEVAPKKAYVSIRRNKQFALIQPSTKTRLDIGINLKNKAENGKLETAGSFNSMVSHRVKISSLDEVDEQLFDWLKQAYEES